MKTRHLFIAVIMTLVLTHGNDKAVAATTPRAIWHAETGLFVGAGQDFRHYTESLNGTSLDSETGVLLSYTLGLRGISRHNKGVYWDILYTHTNGSSRYRGNIQMGLAGNATTGNSGQSLRARLGLVIDGLGGHNAAATFVPYVGLGFRRWNRHLHQALLPGHHMTYSNGHIGVGLLMAYVLARHWVIALHVLAGYTFAAQFTGDESLLFNTTDGTLQSAEITERLGDRPYSALGATVTYLIHRRWQIALHVRRAQWGFGGSAPLFLATQTGNILTPVRVPGGTLTETPVTLEVSHTF